MLNDAEAGYLGWICRVLGNVLHCTGVHLEVIRNTGTQEQGQVNLGITTAVKDEQISLSYL